MKPTGQRVVILGGGSGGVVAATSLGRTLGREHEVTLIDREAQHTYMPGFLFLMTGLRRPSDLQRPLQKLAKNGVRVVQAEVLGIDPSRQTVTLDRGVISYDYLVISLGLQTAPDAIPGFAEGARHPWELKHAIQLRDDLKRFDRGRLLVGIPQGPYRCPPAPFEAQWILDSYFRERGVRERISMEFFTPNAEPVGEEHDASVWMDKESKSRGITQHYQFTAQAIDPARKEVHGLFGYRLPYDLLLMVPPHKPPKVLSDSDMVDSRNGVGVDYDTLVTRWGNIYAIGDCADMPASKAGIVAHQEASVVANNLTTRITRKGTMKSLRLHTI